MLILNSKDSNFKIGFAEILQRAKLDITNLEPKVKEILDSVKNGGFLAIKEQISKFDLWNPTCENDLIIPTHSMKEAYENLDSTLKEALHVAYNRIYNFHSKQMPKTWLTFEDNGNILGQKVSHIQKAGLYIPGGKAAYPSSLLMNAIPAIVAGVEDIIVCTPAPENKVNPLLLAAMHICNIKHAYKIGGATAIATMAYGANFLDKVDVITGPGNIYVAIAKKLVFGEVNIDMIAGPSEIGILADGEFNAEYVALDLLSQAEHDEMASSILVTTNESLAHEVSKRVESNLQNLPKKHIAEQSINNRGAIIIAQNLKEAISLMNEIAPEHLEVLVENPLEILSEIKHAGAIFLGENTPEPIGDYIAGPNHTLPTGGSARFFSPLSVENFLKKSSIISFSNQGILELGEKCAILAKNEGLDAHKNAILARLHKKD